MFLYNCLILQSCILTVYGEACADFYFGSSHYQATFVKADSYSEFQIWNDVTCQQTGYELVSITTLDENNAIFKSLENCTHGDYAIGLSRQMGMPRRSDSSWKWESGETVKLLNWGSNEPNLADSMSAGVYMTTRESFVPGKWHDLENTQKIGLTTGSLGYGYICEKLMITTTYSNTTGATGTTDEPRTEATGATQLFTTAGGTSKQSLTSGVQHTSISTTAGEFTETTANTGEASTKTATHTATHLSTTADTTSIQLTSGRSMQPSSSNSTPTSLLTMVIDENNEGTSRPTSDKPNMKTTSDKATQLSTTADETSIQLTSGRSIQSSSTNTTPTLPTTVIDENKEGTSTSDEPNMKTTTDKDWITVVSVLASFAFVIVVLFLLCRLRERSCCKLKSRLDPELVMINIVKDQPLNDSGNGCCDADSTTKETLICNSVYGKPSIDSANTTGQEKYPGNVANAIITNESTNEPSDISHEADTYLGNQSASTHERENPDEYESEENPTYESYKEEVKSADIDTHDEGEVDNPAYDALPFDGSENLYSSPDEVAGKPDMSMERNSQVESPGNNTIQSETDNDYALLNKMTDVAKSGDVFKENAAPDANDEADSSTDVRKTKPDMSMKLKNRVESPGDNALRSETEKDNASLDKMTDVAGSGDVLVETDATAVHKDDGHNHLHSKTKSNKYELSDKTT